MSEENVGMPWRLLHLSTFCETKGLCSHERHLIGLERIFDMFEKECKPRLGWRKAEKCKNKTAEFWCCLCLESAQDQETAVVVIRENLYNCKGKQRIKKGYVVHKKCLQALSCNKDKMELITKKVKELINDKQVFISKHCAYMQSRVCHLNCHGLNNSRLVNCGMFNCYRSYHLECLPTLADISVDYVERIVSCPDHKHDDQMHNIQDIRRMTNSIYYSISPKSITSCIECGRDIARYPQRLEVVFVGCCEPASFIHYQCAKTRIDRNDYDCPACHSEMKYQRCLLRQGVLLDPNCAIWKPGDEDSDGEDNENEDEDDGGENTIREENNSEDVEVTSEEDSIPRSSQTRRSPRILLNSNNQSLLSEDMK